MATTIFELNFNKQEASSALEVLVYATISSPDDIQFNGYIVIDGVTQQVSTANIILDNSQSRGQIPLTPFAYIRNIAAGVHNIKFIMENTETDNVTLTVRSGATIKVTEYKQGAL